MRLTRPLLAAAIGLSGMAALPSGQAAPRSASLPTLSPVVASLTTTATEVAPGSAVHIVGTLARRDTHTGKVGALTPGTYRLAVRNEDRSIERTYGPFTTLTGRIDQTLPAASTAGVTPTELTGWREVLAVSAVDVRTLGANPLGVLDAGAAGVTVTSAPTGLQVQNDFTSHLGWVKPGESYPFRVFVRNYSGRARANAVVTLKAVDGMQLLGARSGATRLSVSGGTITWPAGTVAGGSAEHPTTKTLIVEARAKSFAQDARVVWKNLSTTAALSYSGGKASSTSHGPKVIPPDETYNTARYGDRPFPVVPIDYADRTHQTASSGARIAATINSPAFKGSTFNLWQETSLGQLFPHAAVPSAGVAQRDVKPSDRLKFSVISPGGTCHGVTQSNPVDGSPLPTYTTRVKDGWYQLPGTTDYYGDDKYGSGLVGALSGVGAIFDIDGACGPTAKAAYDAAVAADPDIDYSDYDTDKDGVVDFFEVIFVGRGGHGDSQIPCTPTEPTCPPQEAVPYDNIWPHSSSLEFTYTDAATGQTGYITHDQLKDLAGQPLYYTDASRSRMTTRKTAYVVYVRVGPYNVNPENALQHASVISHEYGHSLGLPDFYSLGSRETYGDWNLMATDKSQGLDVFSRQDMGWIVPREVPVGTSTVRGFRDSKVDTHEIAWRTPGGQPYTLRGASVHNAHAFTAKIPGRKLVDPTKFKGASPTHAWWSQSGNDFGCPPNGGHNLDIYLPQLKNVPAGTKVTASFKSMWDIEWDYDYGFVLIGKPDSRGAISTYTSVPSTNNYTTPSVINPNQNGCQAQYGNGITGTSGSYKANTSTVDRGAGNTPEMEFVPDSFDISALAGSAGVLRFGYATDPGLARPGWFIDDLVITAGNKVIYTSNFEKDKGPDAPQVYNGGCKEGSAVASRCTHGWQYLDASLGATADRGYYLEMRARSGFDFNGKGQNDRAAIAFKPGALLVYTDESHGYGNVGTDDPPAQSPLDAHPTAGSETPNLNDAAFTEGDTFSDITGHTDNYTDPSSESGNWEFRNNCLAFTVTKLSNDDIGPDVRTSGENDLASDVKFTRRSGCGSMDYGFGVTGKTNHAPVAVGATKALADGRTSLDAIASYDDFDDPFALRYSWDTNGDGVSDATGSHVTTRLAHGLAGVTLTVTDSAGLSTTKKVGLAKAGTTAAPVTPGAGGSAPSAAATEAGSAQATEAHSFGRGLPGGLIALALALILLTGLGVALQRRN